MTIFIADVSFIVVFLLIFGILLLVATCILDFCSYEACSFLLNILERLRYQFFKKVILTITAVVLYPIKIMLINRQFRSVIIAVPIAMLVIASLYILSFMFLFYSEEVWLFRAIIFDYLNIPSSKPLRYFFPYTYEILEQYKGGVKGDILRHFSVYFKNFVMLIREIRHWFLPVLWTPVIVYLAALCYFIDTIVKVRYERSQNIKLINTPALERFKCNIKARLQ
jgi:hypothetical protein